MGKARKIKKKYVTNFVNNFTANGHVRLKLQEGLLLVTREGYKLKHGIWKYYVPVLSRSFLVKKEQWNRGTLLFAKEIDGIYSKTVAYKDGKRNGKEITSRKEAGVVDVVTLKEGVKHGYRYSKSVGSKQWARKSVGSKQWARRYYKNGTPVGRHSLAMGGNTVYVERYDKNGIEHGVQEKFSKGVKVEERFLQHGNLKWKKTWVFDPQKVRRLEKTITYHPDGSQEEKVHYQLPPPPAPKPSYGTVVIPSSIPASLHYAVTTSTTSDVTAPQWSVFQVKTS